ncbi:hypothetical protein CEXT_326081 [Caerostris extrusa]|uniref:Uncharacterized protein n=1 Tax=Caerostris extrusa TaxID=172846 RepID=A0AAV4X4B7_CAEEX|nr:hypothetical protein CEXT_326081 [Caerostris extrusa]
MYVKENKNKSKLYAAANYARSLFSCHIVWMRTIGMNLWRRLDGRMEGDELETVVVMATGCCGCSVLRKTWCRLE